MAVLLARTAERLYWGARYIERAEDTARIIRAYHDLVVDYPSSEMLSWEPLAAIHGSASDVEPIDDDPALERAVLAHVIGDLDNPSSIRSSVRAARENLRATREVMPREAWQAVNELSHYVDATASAAVERQLRDHFLVRVVQISRRLDGTLESTMSRGREHRMLRLGRLIERADMTTRVVGVAAASIMSERSADGGVVDGGVVAEQVRWMSVLRSVSALQMYQRSDRGPIDGVGVVRFLLFEESFPRSVLGCLRSIRTIAATMPGAADVVSVVDATVHVLEGADPHHVDAEKLDRAMDRVQLAIAELHDAFHRAYVGHVL